MTNHRSARARLLRLAIVLVIGITGHFAGAGWAPATALRAPVSGECGVDCPDPGKICFAASINANGNSPGGARPPVTCRPLVLLRLPTLPASPGRVSVFHGELVPDSAVNLDAVSGPLVLYVEQGQAIVEWQADAPTPEIRRGLINVEPENVAPVTDPHHHAALIKRWDWIAVAPGVPHVLVGADQELSQLLGVSIVSVDASNYATPQNRSERMDPAWSTVLAEGMFPLLPPVPALLAIARSAYDAHAADDQLTQNVGPLLTVVESGTFLYLSAGGQSVVVRARGGQLESVTPGVEVLLAAGDAIIEQPGVISGLRNMESTRSFVLMVGLSPTLERASANETVADSVRAFRWSKRSSRLAERRLIPHFIAS